MLWRHLKSIYSVYGQEIITEQLVQKWFANLCSGELLLEDEPGLAYLSDCDDEALASLAEKIPW